MSRTDPSDADLRRVRRLLRWYPARWRRRYGDEFTELLLAEMAEQPSSPRRTANVIGNGLLARLTQTGLTNHELPPGEQVRAGLTTVGCTLSAFAALAVAMLAQLATGWQWTSPHSAATTASTLVLTVAFACLALGFLAGPVQALLEDLTDVFGVVRDGEALPDKARDAIGGPEFVVPTVSLGSLEQ